MVFDTARMRELRERYEGHPDVRVPRVVFLDRHEELQPERALVDRLVGSVRESKQRDWVGRFVSVDHSQHMGAWFEVMLFDWLSSVGPVEVEPDVEGDSPDFLLTTGDDRVAIEATVAFIPAERRKRERGNAEVFWTLTQLSHQYLVHVRAVTIAGRFPWRRFQREVDKWLRDGAKGFYTLEDERGNRALLSAQPFPRLKRTQAFSMGEFMTISGRALRNPLKQKAKQHPRLRAAGHPYVVALFLEDFMLDAEEVVEAWFGGIQVQVDINALRAVSQTFDLTGAHFLGREIVHRSLAGTLVFKAKDVPDEGRHRLRAWWVQNPFANVSLESGLFPVESRFVVTARDPLAMGWLRTT